MQQAYVTEDLRTAGFYLLPSCRNSTIAYLGDDPSNVARRLLEEHPGTAGDEIIDCISADWSVADMAYLIAWCTVGPTEHLDLLVEALRALKRACGEDDDVVGDGVAWSAGVSA